jgi:hypothetical protein
MARKRPSTPGPALDETSAQLPEPTEFAELEISVGPAQRARGRVPPDQADLLITTFSILSSAVIGIGGAVLTLHIAATLTGLALAELAFAFVATLLIAACSRTRANRKNKPGRKTGGRKRPDGTRS